MTTKEIIENNKLIAEFMEIDDVCKFAWDNIDDPYLSENWVNMGKPLLFHRSWDWLIPVLTKIQKIKTKRNEQYYTKKGLKEEDSIDIAECIMELESMSVLNPNLERCFALCCDIAIWYNKIGAK